MVEPIRIQRLEDVTAFVDKVDKPIVMLVEHGKGIICGSMFRGVIGYRVGTATPNIRQVINDFLNYETAQRRTPLLFALGDCALPLEHVPAQDDPEWLVHSTDDSAGQSVLETGCLYSRAALKAQGTAFRAFGREVLGEPADYHDLINLSPLDSCAPEIVVASKEHGRFCSEEAHYHPGIRFCFCVQDLVTQPGFVRFMGGIAIRHSLQLGSIRHVTVSASELPQSSSWTPKSFTAAANGLFRQKQSGPVSGYYQSHNGGFST